MDKHRIKIFWKDGRSEIRTVSFKELNKWLKAAGSEFVEKVKELKESKFEKYILESLKD